MSLARMLEQMGSSEEAAENQFKLGISEERVAAQLQPLRNLISFFREYPDIFIDFIKGPNCTFKFYYYQRVFIRIVMRHKYVYATFPRAFSKSFLSMMVLMLRCILFPGSELFITTGGKERIACSALL